MLQDDEQLLQLHGDLHHRRQDDKKGALLLAGDELGEGGLNHLRAAQETVEVVHQEQCGASAVSQAGQRPQRGQRIARPYVGVRFGCRRADAQAVGDVPDGSFPLLVAGELEDFALGFVGLLGLDPETGEGGVDVVGQLVGQLHG